MNVYICAFFSGRLYVIGTEASVPDFVHSGPIIFEVINNSDSKENGRAVGKIRSK